MPNFLFSLILLLTFTAICASETSSGEMDLNSILIQPADANKFLSAKGVAKGVHAGGRRLGRCGSGTWWEEKGWFSQDECHDCGTGQYQNENRHKHASCKGKKVVLVVFVLLFYLAATCIIFTPEPDIFIYILP